jgi:hypothetical protein
MGAVAYRSIFGSLDPVPIDVEQMAQHFRENGLDVRVYAVRNGFPHSVLIAAAAFEIKGYPLPVSIDVCSSTAVAASHLVDIARSPNLMGPMQNGRLIMYLPMWGSDTADMARRVHSAFSSFRVRT